MTKRILTPEVALLAIGLCVQAAGVVYAAGVLSGRLEALTIAVSKLETLPARVAVVESQIAGSLMLPFPAARPPQQVTR